MTSLTYRLPLTELAISGVLRTVRDDLNIVNGQSAIQRSLVSSDVKLVTSGDLEIERTLAPPTGSWTTYKGTFGLTPDRRLSSASADSTSEIGAAVKSVASLAGTVAALAIIALGPGEKPKDDADDENILGAYKEAYGDEHDAFIELRKQRKDVEARIREAITRSVDGTSDLEDLRRLRSLLAFIDERLVPADAHFRAWRGTKIASVDEASSCAFRSLLSPHQYMRRGAPAASVVWTGFRRPSSSYGRATGLASRGRG